MKNTFNLFLLLLLVMACKNNNQEQTTTSIAEKIPLPKETKAVAPELMPFQEEAVWAVHNRQMTLGDEIYLNAAPKDGLLWNTEETFGNGTIEFEVKGRDKRGQSFVGFAFHIQDKDHFDAIYFRPFNFGHAEKGGNALQYISIPGNEWFTLREKHPEVYENAVQPVPEKEDWFSVKIVVNYPKVEVYVNDVSTPSLVVNQLSTYKKGGYGFWVGNNSDGYFRHLKIATK